MIFSVILLTLLPLLRACVSIPKCSVSKYRILKELSRGGQATIYLALKNSELRIIKKFDRLHSFRTEFNALSCLPKHPGIIKVLCQDHSRRALVLHYLRGSKPKDLSISQIKELVVTIESIHKAGYVHADIKPSNMIEHQGHVTLIDFGLARKISRLSGRFGTATFMAPEVANGHPRHNVSLDWYSLGRSLQLILDSTSNSKLNDFINRLLERNPRVRLVRCSNLLSHPIFH